MPDERELAKRRVVLKFTMAVEWKVPNVVESVERPTARVEKFQPVWVLSVELYARKFEVRPMLVERVEKVETHIVDSVRRAAPVERIAVVVEKKREEMDPLNTVERLLTLARSVDVSRPIAVERVERPNVRVERFDPVTVEKVEKPNVRVERFDPRIVDTVDKPVCRVEKFEPAIVDTVERPTWATLPTVLIPTCTVEKLELKMLDKEERATWAVEKLDPVCVDTLLIPMRRL